MSATEELLDTGYPNELRPELHKALKARGIDYWVAQGITFWNRDDWCECLAYGYKANGVPKLAVKVVGFTDPAQAIAATLGVEPIEREPDGWYKCPKCGCVVGYDELYGGGWAIVMDDYQIPFNHCPSCGEVVDQ